MTKRKMFYGSLFLSGAIIISAFGIGNFSISEEQENGKFKTVEIGDQTWMAENLDVSHFRNGDTIPEIKTNEEWKNAGENGQPAWCYYRNEGFNGEKYGKLYNWYAVNDPRGLAPEGWHVPSDEEWTDLEEYLASDAGSKMKSTSGWEKNGNGTNESSFSGLPGGSRDWGGYFDWMGSEGSWWSSTEPNTNYAWYRYLNYESDGVSRSNWSKRSGFSVRCLSD